MGNSLREIFRLVHTNRCHFQNRGRFSLNEKEYSGMAPLYLDLCILVGCVRGLLGRWKFLQ